MTLRSVLVHVEPSDEGELRVAYALRLAAAHDAFVTALYVDSGLVFPALVDAPTSPVLVEHLDEERKLRAEQAADLFARQAADVSVSHQWLSEQGEPVATLVRHGYCADIIVVGQASVHDTKLVLGGLPDGVSLTSGRPVLVVPNEIPPSTTGENVLVAWNWRREAVRAIHDALPVLKRAREVSLVHVSLTTDTGDESDAMKRIGGHLQRHGVRASLVTLSGNDGDVGKVLNTRAEDAGHDMLVMGAYGHSRLREIVLGGTTRHVLKNMRVPVFMSH